ncbi:hypothetical protein [Rhodospirillaceae bacterium SYSU D60014]|jgi:hypothetical protein|uniref:hypothetical protein n=1 Tax=Virgifigura deserti TaxID=2268457 RepID=UPI000E662F96
MSKRRRSYWSRTRNDRLPDGGIAAHETEVVYPGLTLLSTPYRRLFFFAGVAGIVALVIATAMAV